MPAPQSFAIGFGGGLSADATRTDKFTFYYLVPDLMGDEPSCHADKRDSADLYGTSLLRQSDLGIYKWLNNAMYLRSSVGISRPSEQEVMTYDVKFDIVSSGDFTPSWELVYVTTRPSIAFSGTDALLTFFDFPAEHWTHLRTSRRTRRGSWFSS
jgi:hypothetical protein